MVQKNMNQLRYQPKEEVKAFLKAIITLEKKLPSKNKYTLEEEAARDDLKEQLSLKGGFEPLWWKTFVKRGRAMLKNKKNQYLYDEVDEEGSDDKVAVIEGEEIEDIGEAVGEGGKDGEGGDNAYVFVNEEEWLDKLIEEDEGEEYVPVAASQISFESDTLPTPEEIIIFRSSSYESDATPPSPVMYAGFRNLFVSNEASTNQMTGIPVSENVGGGSNIEVESENIEQLGAPSAPQQHIDIGAIFGQHITAQQNFAAMQKDIAEKQLDAIVKLAEINKKK